MSIKVFINSRQANNSKKTGKGVYARAIIDYLKTKSDLEVIELNHNFWSKLGLWHLFVALKLKGDKNAIYFDPESFITPFFVSLLTNQKVVVTIHDMVAFNFAKGHFLKPLLIERIFLPLLVKMSKVKFFCVSNFTKTQFCNYFNLDNARVSVTPLGFDYDSEHNSSKSAIVDTSPKIVCVSTFLERKNQISLVYEFSLIKHEIPHNLYLIGGGDTSYVNKVQNLIYELKLQDRVFITGFISKDHKNRLIQEAEFSIYPSLYEGFGIPLLESVSQNTPVITTKNTVMQEVCEDAALYFDPKKTTDLAFQIKYLAGNKELQQILLNNSQRILAKYSWENTASKVYNEFKKLA
jgi:glycosyltransferase involved in cell wall biosynthesis